MKVICNSCFGCIEREQCGAAKPHEDSFCEPCPFDKGAICVSCISECEHEKAGYCQIPESDCHWAFPADNGNMACEKAL